jgi:hypothetical protein
MSFTDCLFHTPWWLPTLIIVVGAVIFYVANNRQEVRPRTVGLSIVCLGILLAVVSYFVDTDLEKAETHTRQLIRAVNDKDWPKARSLLDRNTTVSIANVTTLYRGGDQIVAKAQEATDRYGLQSVTVTGINSRQDQSLITISASVVSIQTYVGAPITSRWEFDYQQAADGWFLNEIRAVEIGRAQGEQMQHMFPGR